MLNVVGLVRHRYHREIVAQVGPEFGSFRIAALVDSVGDLAEVLRSTTVDIVTTGQSTAIGVAEVCAVHARGPRPMLALVHKCCEVAARQFAVDHELDVVIDFSRGLEEAAKLTEEKYRLFRNGMRDLSHHRCMSPLPSEVGIHVTNDVDREIVALVALGRCDREIAEVINYSHQTVRNRVSKILQTTGARNRTHLATIYLNRMHNGFDPFLPGPIGLSG